MLKAWVEAMRLRTLPVSLAGIAWAAGLARMQGAIEVTPLVGCLLFALLAQIASNFANEYFDYRDGLDRPGREGFRRGVTEGDISARAMARAAAATLLTACCIGVLLVAIYGRWWMYAVGVVTALGAVAYSAGPFPLSRHALGEPAVICFFGIVPVVLSVILIGGEPTLTVWLAAVGVGLMGANVLMVNNTRDIPDDSAVGKVTLAVLTGRRAMTALYLLSGIAAWLLTLPAWRETGLTWWWATPALYLVGHAALALQLSRRSGAALNQLLGMTAMLMALYALAFLIISLL